MTATNATRLRSGAPAQSAGGAFGSVLTAAVQAASDKVDQWSTRFEGIAAGDPGAVDDVADDLALGGGAQRQAGVRGVQAGLAGRSPVWAAIKGAWSGGGTATRAAVVTAGLALLLAAVLSPVLVLVFLLSALVIEAIHRVRSTTG